MKLTEVIVGANAVPQGFTTEAAPETPGPLQFFTRNEDYRSVTILRDARGVAGLHVMVWEVPVDFPRPSCASPEATNADCEERTINGVPVVLSTARGVGGAISYSATSARPDGT